MGFTFDGISSRKFGIDTRMDIENRIPEIRNSTSQIAGHHGVFDFGQSISERKIEIACLIIPGQTPAGLLKLKDDIVAWLNPDKGLCKLVLDGEKDRKYYARLEDGISFERIVRTTGTFTLKFFCPDPFAYAIDDEEYELVESGNIKRHTGNVESHPEYIVSGVLETDEDTLTFSVNGEAVTLHGPINEGQTVYIDTENMTAKLVDEDGVESNALGLMEELNFPYLPVGDNTVTFGCSENGTFDTLRIKARSRWL